MKMFCFRLRCYMILINSVIIGLTRDKGTQCDLEGIDCSILRMFYFQNETPIIELFCVWFSKETAANVVHFLCQTKLLKISPLYR